MISKTQIKNVVDIICKYFAPDKTLRMRQK